MQNYPLEPSGRTNITQRFTRQHKITSSADYQSSFGFPLCSRDDFLLILAQHNNLSQPRLGLTVAKKRAKKAVHRNKIKRIIREQFRRHQDKLGGLDIIVILSRMPPPELLSTELTSSLEKHWKKITA